MKVLATEDLYNDRELTARITSKIKEFETFVWFRGLQEQVLASKCRGLSANFGPLSVMTYTIAGRTMITIKRKNVHVSAVADETSKESRTELQGIYGTEEDVVDLIDWAIYLADCGMLRFRNDKDLSIG